MSKPAHTKSTTMNNMGINPILSAEKREEIDKVKKIGSLALENAGRIVRELGASGIKDVRKNQYGDIALEGDVEAEKAILDVLRKNKLQIKVVSEEYGITFIGDNSLYLGILDGIDGSGVYKRERATGRYGTMFAIYEGTDPTYDDYLYSGIFEHVSKKLYFASKGGGCWVIENGKQKRLYCSGSVKLGNKSEIYGDTNFDEVYKSQVVSAFLARLRAYDFKCARSSAIHYADLSSGKVDGVIEATRKGNLEMAVAFPLITEAGGVMVDKDGHNLGDKKYSEFGQKDHLIVVSAATSSLAIDILNKAKDKKL